MKTRIVNPFGSEGLVIKTDTLPCAGDCLSRYGMVFYEGTAILLGESINSPEQTIEIVTRIGAYQKYLAKT